VIRVTIELLPHGFEEGKRHLGTMVIGNDLSSVDDVTGNYNIRLSKRGQPDSFWRKGRVEGFPRKRLGVYDLMYRALRNIVGGRNP
jgi:hypothetical protein